MIGLHGLMRDAALRAPAFSALRVNGTEFSRLDIEERANQIAYELRQHGVGKGVTVAVVLGRTFQLIPALLAVLKTGAAYLPIDPNLPAARVMDMVRRSAISVALVDGSSEWETEMRLAGLTSPVMVAVESIGEARRDFQDADVSPDDPAYVIFTSGSTGLPKGVVVTHRGLTNLASTWHRAIPYHKATTMASLTTVAFDVFVAETLLPILYGLEVVLGTDNETSGPTAVGTFLLANRCDALQVTPSRLRWLLSDPRAAASLTSVNLLIIGGERFPEDLLPRLRALTAGDIYNVYGPTEATVWTSAKLIKDGEEVTIGTPIDGVTYNTRTVGHDDGDLGELLIGGKALAAGYVGDPVATARAFEASPFLGNTIVYRTGDLVRQHFGEYCVVGRLDQQVKIDGYRVELGEIEAVLESFPGVAAAAVTLIDSGLRSTLAAVLSTDTPNESALRTHLREQLPRYMTPSTFVWVGELPFTTSGKIDRPAVREIVRRHMLTTSPTDPLEFIRGEVEQALGVDLSSRELGLIELGLASILIARLVVELEQRYEVELDFEEVVRAPTLVAIADLVVASRKRIIQTPR